MIFIIPVRFSLSHFEFFGLMWLSHHQEYMRLDSAFDKLAITAAKNTTKSDLGPKNPIKITKLDNELQPGTSTKPPKLKILGRMKLYIFLSLADYT